jgi:hypothetical protein
MCLTLLVVAAAAAQPATVEPADRSEAKSEVKSDAKSDNDVVKLREEVERLHRTLERQHEENVRQIEALRKALETRMTGLANGIDAVRISVDAVKNAIGSMQPPRRPAITVTADSAAPIVCGAMGCEATALDHCRKSGYEAAHVVHKLEKPVQWLYTFVCRDG